ncbi:hypothetical protein D770_22250 [Flammeovirgaceae bacterium 311]|nr:hypothetical protein D770_22250 [Flammeovirgaceae bacterium 311]
MDNIMNWYTRQLQDANYNRLGLMAFILLVHTCIIVPATLLVIVQNGNSLIEFTIMGVLSFSVLAALLGDVSAKVTVPLFVVSALIHLLIIMTYAF